MTDRSLTRRQALGRLAASGVLLATASGAARAATAAPADMPLPACVVRPEQTEGPFFVDRVLDRSDLRSDPRDGATRPGVPLRLVFAVSRAGVTTCPPLAGARVDVWHCDAGGNYSDGNRRRDGAGGPQFLRGYQTTDGAGQAQFLTIYPGWYPGRAVHVHFKIRTASASSAPPDATFTHEFTSQLYFDEALSERVFASAPYANHRGRPTPNADDFLFRDRGEQLLIAPRLDGQAYIANFAIGLKL